MQVTASIEEEGKAFYNNPPHDFPSATPLPGFVSCAADVFNLKPQDGSHGHSSHAHGSHGHGSFPQMQIALLTEPVIRWLLERSGFGETEECEYLPRAGTGDGREELRVVAVKSGTK